MASINLFMVTIFLQILITFLIINTGNSKNLPSTVLIFGDSTMDTGNNNYIKTILKGNFLPYGQNFPGNVPPTGRFSNGKLVPDFLASALGIKDKVPPFLDPNLSNEELVSGVCFASAGSGWDDLTTLMTRVITADKQIDMFKDYIKRVKGIVGDENNGMKIVNDALVVISAGTNDFGYNFYGVPTRRFQYTVDRYQDFLLLRLQSFVKALYELGCRRMLIAGLPPMGCLPLQMTAKFQNPLDRKCLEDQNSESKAYNNKLSNLINQLQTLLPHGKIVYADIYSPLLDMIQNPKKYGFVETNKGCCGTGLLEVAFLCNPTRPVCQNPSQFIFWDSLHPTQSAYEFLTKQFVTETIPKMSFGEAL